MGISSCLYFLVSHSKLSESCHNLHLNAFLKLRLKTRKPDQQNGFSDLNILHAGRPIFFVLEIENNMLVRCFSGITVSYYCLPHPRKYSEMSSLSTAIYPLDNYVSLLWFLQSPGWSCYSLSEASLVQLSSFMCLLLSFLSFFFFFPLNLFLHRLFQPFVSFGP